LKEFTAIAEAKPDCAMAYWGIAMSVWNQIWAPPTPANLKKGSDAITQALALNAKTPRERRRWSTAHSPRHRTTQSA
jgi:hypothetical protein